MKGGQGRPGRQTAGQGQPCQLCLTSVWCWLQRQCLYPAGHVVLTDVSLASLCYPPESTALKVKQQRQPHKTVTTHKLHYSSDLLVSERARKCVCKRKTERLGRDRMGESVCVRMRGGERERDRQTETERDTQREHGIQSSSCSTPPLNTLALPITCNCTLKIEFHMVRSRKLHVWLFFLLPCHIFKVVITTTAVHCSMKEST